jgi:ribonuclease E
MPRVTAFDLPVAQLHDVAQSSGLQWVLSDPARVASVQAAIAAEPKPVHVPRERPAPVVIDDGPLILVETKRDLSRMAMPMEDSTTH